jgi:hypothetical protein
MGVLSCAESFSDVVEFVVDGHEECHEPGKVEAGVVHCSFWLLRHEMTKSHSRPFPSLCL